MNDIRERMDSLVTATGRLLDTARSLGDGHLTGQSLCEGWTRGHVLTHLARNADGATRLLWWARTGVPWFQYLSHTLREAEIDDGARRPLADQVTDLEHSAGRVLAEAKALTAQDWERQIRWLAGSQQPAHRVLDARLAEVEYHHVDLDAGYGFADWPPAYLARQVEVLARRLTPRAATSFQVAADDAGVRATVGAAAADSTVAGSAASMVGWLSGRRDGRDLQLTPPGPLPSLPAYG